MSAFKKLDDRSILLTSQYIEKKWSSSIAQDSYGIQVSTGEVNSGFLFPSQSNFNSNLNYRSLKHLYYSNLSKVEGELTSSVSSSFESYDQTTLHDTFRILSGSITYISFPRNITGNFIKPGSFLVSRYETNRSGLLYDNGEGKLLYSGSLNISGSTTVGDVIYGHGIVLVNNNVVGEELVNNSHFTASWSSMYPVFETQIMCPVKNYEFNFSQNPTTRDSNGNLIGKLSGSVFSPYITAIGLYNDSSELLAVAKLSQPVPKSTFTDTVFKIQLDS